MPRFVRHGWEPSSPFGGRVKKTTAMLLLLFGTNPQAVLAQTHASPARPQAAPKLYRIAGTVTNPLSGEPVPRATVSLMDEDSRETLQSAETDAEGHFALGSVPAGKYPLCVAQRGYLASCFDEHENFSSAIVTGEDQDTEHIPFQLRPGAMVHGVVTDDAGEPVQNAHVMLFEKSNSGGLGERFLSTISGTTDDQGGFEFWDLAPGTYFVAVQATPWFALHPSLAANASADQASAAKALDVAYATTFFDGVTDQAAATAVPLRSGDHVELSVALHAVPAVHVLAHSAPDAAPNRFRPPDQFTQTIFGQEESIAAQMARPGPAGSGQMEYFGMAPGHYSVTQGDPPRLIEFDATGSGTLDLDAATGLATTRVTMKVRMSGTATVPSPVRLILRSDSDSSREIRGLWAGDGKIQFEAVPPGLWTVFPQNQGSKTFGVVSIQNDGAARPDSRIEVKDRPLSLTVTLARGATAVNGFAMVDKKGVAGAMIVLVPQDPAANPALFRRDQSDSDGSFSLKDAVPGSYTVVAIEDGWELDWAHPEVIRRYLSLGVPVTIPDASPKVLHLPKTVPVQPR